MNRGWYAFCIMLVIVLVVVVAFYARIAEHNSATVQAALEAQLRRLPAPPGAMIQSQSASHKLDSALVGRNYSLASPYGDIRDFYPIELAKRGWQVTGEHRIADWGRDLGGEQLDFCKGLYGASLNFAGPRADSGWTYALFLRWGPHLASRHCTEISGSRELTRTEKILALLFRQPPHDE